MSTVNLIEDIYAASANAGLLKRCAWSPANGDAAQEAWVGFHQLQRVVFDHLAASVETTMSYPASRFVNLAPAEIVVVAGVRYEVRHIDNTSDGDERRATLFQL